MFNGAYRSAVLFVLLVAAPVQAQTQSATTSLERAADTAYCSRDYNRAIELTNEIQSKAPADPSFEFSLNQIDRLAGANEALRNYDAAAQNYRALLKLIERQFGNQNINYAIGLEALARILVLNGKVEEGEVAYVRVEPMRRMSLRKLAGDIVDSNPALMDEMMAPFLPRHYANAGRFALARQDWQRAFDRYRKSIELMNANPALMQSGDSLVDLSSEQNNSTFVGLMRAAWELRKSGNENGMLLDETAFGAVQQKWQTDADRTLRAAIERRASRPASLVQSPGAATPAKRLPSERVAKLRKELEDIEEAHMAELESNSSYNDALKLETDASRDFMSMSAGEQKALLGVLAKITNTCMSKRPTPCNVGMADAFRVYRGQPLTEPTMADQLARATQSSPDTSAYEKRRVEIYTELGLNEDGTDPVSIGVEPVAAPEVPPNPKAQDLVDTGTLRNLLKPDEALITFLVGNDDGFVWAITRDQSVWSPVDIKVAELESAVKALRQGLEPPSEGETGVSEETHRHAFPLSVAHELYAKLLGPVDKIIAGKKHVIVVPSGIMTSLPFQVLVKRAPEAGLSELDGYRKAAWLVRDHALSVFPGIASFKKIRETPRSAAGATTLPFLGMGAAIFGKPISPFRPATAAATGSAARCSPEKFALDTELKDLPGTKAEVQQVGAALSASADSIVLAEAATEAKIKTLARSGDLGRFKVLYFSTHGLVAGDIKGLVQPALAMTTPQAPSAEDDGLLTAEEIVDLDLSADVVVLSACNTASARRPGEEILSGLGSAFLHAGARALVVSHWMVDDTAAVMLMTETFKNRNATGSGLAIAQQRAMNKMIDDTESIASHPSYWSPFVVVGDGLEGVNP